MSASDLTSLSPPPRSTGRASSSATTATAPRTGSRPSFSIAYTQHPSQSVSSSSVAPRNPASSSMTSPSRRSSSGLPPPLPPSSNHSSAPTAHAKHFVAPAHPQSHHLHTLPPREKTTRTLILDHTAWQHTRTRLAQGRSELGMRTRLKRSGQVKREGDEDGGRVAFYIGSSMAGVERTSAFGNPPEMELASSEDEGEDEDGRESDVEGLSALNYGTRHDTKDKDWKAKAGGEDKDRNKDGTMDMDGNIVSPTDDETTPSDVALAPALAARATGIEKVLRAMLAQPPSPPPRSPSPPPYALHSAHVHSQHYRAPPSTFTHASTTTVKRPRTLPNGVRLRLALLAVVNDLFERQSPAFEDPPSSPTRLRSSTNASISESAKASATSSPPSSPTQLPPPSLPPPNTLPPALAALAQVSSQPFHGPPTLPSFHTLTLPSSSAGGGTSGAMLSPISGIHASDSNLGGRSKGSVDGGQTRRPPPPLFTWSHPSRGSASPSSTHAVSPLGPPSHEHDGDRVSITSPVSPSFSRTSSAPSRTLPASWRGSASRNHHPGASSSLGFTRRAVGRARELYAVGCYAGPNPQTPGYRGSYRSDVTTFAYGTSSAPTVAGYPLQKLKTLCPRHLLEKCVICSGGRGGPASRIGAGLLKKADACGGGDAGAGVLADMVPRFLRLSALVAMELGREARGEETEGIEGGSTSATSTVSNSAVRHAQPTRAWYALLCGLLTRAVLEGYVARGWKGAEYSEVLMGVGLGIKGIGTRRSSTGFGGSIPPDIPVVEEEDAGEFEPDEMPGLVDAGKVMFTALLLDPGTDDLAEEYASEMEARMSEFLAIPHATPDLATHLTALSAQYPAAPVERAALRFCEAVAKWRGRPELETYKTAFRATTPGTLPIHALLASPAPRRPPIERYFRIVPAPRKRAHTGAGEERATKREKTDVDMGEEAMQDVDVVVDLDAEWVGPYGV